MNDPPTLVGGIRKLLSDLRRLELNHPPTVVGGIRSPHCGGGIPGPTVADGIPGPTVADGIPGPTVADGIPDLGQSMFRMIDNKASILVLESGDGEAAVRDGAAFVAPDAVDSLGAGRFVEAFGDHAEGFDRSRKNDDVPVLVSRYLPTPLMKRSQLEHAFPQKTV